MQSDNNAIASAVQLVPECSHRVNFLWDTAVLQQVLERTRHALSLGGWFYLDVQHAQPCTHCGKLIAPIRFDNGPLQWFEALCFTTPPEVWLDRHTTPDEYVANLARIHHCQEPQKGVRQ